MNWTAIWKALLIQMLAKNELMDAIRSLHQMPERFPFLEAEFIPPNKYHKMFAETVPTASRSNANVLT